MKSPKRILVLMAEAGFGHRRAAEAVAAALKEMYAGDCEVEIDNPLDDKRTPALLRKSQYEYDQTVRDLPNLYKLSYEATNAALPTAVIEGALLVTLFEVMRDRVRRYRPDAIVTTYMHYLVPLEVVFAIEKQHIPLLTVVTDLASIHRLWFNTVSDLTLVPTSIAQELAIKSGLAAEKVRITGIPVDPKIAAQQAQDPAVLRDELGWRRDLVTILAVGSKRTARLLEMLRPINHSGLPVQIVAVAGGDDRLYRKLQRIEWHVPAHMYNYVSEIPVFQRASDIILSKAGGLIVSEALASGLPMLFTELIAGQETGNASYVIEGGAGELAGTPLEALEILFHWLENDGKLLAERKANARALGHPRAAFEVAGLAWEAAQHGPYPERGRLSLPKLNELRARLKLPPEPPA